MLSLAGLKFEAFAPAPTTSLPIAECDALSVNPKVYISNSNLRLSVNSSHKNEYIIKASEKCPTKLPIVVLNESVGTLLDSDYLKVIRLVSQNRKVNYRYKSLFSNITKKLIKVPP